MTVGPFTEAVPGFSPENRAGRLLPGGGHLKQCLGHLVIRLGDPDLQLFLEVFPQRFGRADTNLVGNIVVRRSHGGHRFDEPPLLLGRLQAWSGHAGFSSAGTRSVEIASNERPSPSSTACLPVCCCHRLTVTSTYLGSISIPQHTRPVSSAAASVVPLPRNGS